MPITRSYRETVIARVQRDPAFRMNLLTRGISYIIAGSDEDVLVGKSLVRDYIVATIGYEKLSSKTGIPEKSINRMFGADGNPYQSHLNILFRTLLSQEGMKAEDFIPPKARKVLP
jgi:hypothetical protein